jgi:hypothetical protein
MFLFTRAFADRSVDIGLEGIRPFQFNRATAGIMVTAGLRRGEGGRCRKIAASTTSHESDLENRDLMHFPAAISAEKDQRQSYFAAG